MQQLSARELHDHTEFAAEVAEEMDLPLGNVCVICFKEIKTMAFRGSGICSEIHRKVRDGEPLGVSSVKSY